MRILAVDDEPSILELLTTFLEAEDGNEIVTASSGEHALAIVETSDSDFDCILIDIQMPQMNGITLCENIRAVPGYFHVPIIMLTAMSQKSYIEKAFAVGATDYVTKPFDFLELRCRLKAAAKIVHEYNRACNVADTARRLIIDSRAEKKPHPDEPLSIDDVDRVVGYTAFENFVLAMSRARLLFATTFAVKILEFGQLHEEVSTREMRAILRKVAELVAEIAPGPGNLISYRGGGVFLCVKQKKSGPSHSARVVQIDVSPPLGSGFTAQKADVLLVVGEEVSLGSIARTGALLALRRAVENVEQQRLSARDMAKLATRRAGGPAFAVDQSSLARHAYELVLKEIIREEGRHVG
jgi:CheY-like chemotaxis protein